MRIKNRVQVVQEPKTDTKSVEDKVVEIVSVDMYHAGCHRRLVIRFWRTFTAKPTKLLGCGHSATKWCGRNAKERKQTWGASAKVGLKRKGGENAKVR